MTEANPQFIIGQNIRLLREQLGLTQDALAQYLAIPKKQISDYENGSLCIPSSQLSKLADLFCLNEYDFYEPSPSKRKTDIAFAFRADTLKPEDLASITRFKKIVRNYLKMKEILQEN